MNESLNKKSLQAFQDSSSLVSSNDQLPPFKDDKAFEKMHHILSNNQIDILKKMKDNLLVHYETGQVFRSEVEMRFSVLNDTKFPTADAKYWQAVREQNVHFTNLIILGYEYDTEQIKIKNICDLIKKNQIKQKRLDRDLVNLRQLKNEKDELDVESLELDIELLQNKIDTLNVESEKLSFFQAERKKVSYNRWREVVTWEKIIFEIKPSMKYGILSYEHHQPGSYARRMEKQVQIMKKSGAKGSPSEAINITSQNNMIKKLINNGVLRPDRELPIDRAVREVVGNIDSGKNYINNSDSYVASGKEEPLLENKQYINDNLDEIFTPPANNKPAPIPANNPAPANKPVDQHPLVEEILDKKEDEEQVYNPQVPQ